MASGQTAILINHDSIYESLYDVLNQRFVMKTDLETGVVKKMLRLALGPRSQLCPVADEFKLIIIVNKYHAYDNLDLPLLNRFEKQVFEPDDVLNQDLKKMEKELSIWCESICKELGFKRVDDIFCGYYDGTIPSLLLSLTNFGRDICDSDEKKDIVIKAAQSALQEMAIPSAILYSTILRRGKSLREGNSSSYFEEEDFLKDHADIFAYLENRIFQLSNSNVAYPLHFIVTKSPLTHFDLTFKSYFDKNKEANHTLQWTIDESNLIIINLNLIASESQLIRTVQDFYNRSNELTSDTLSHVTDKCCANGHKCLIFLCDPLECDPQIITHATFLCTQQRALHISNVNDSNEQNQHSNRESILLIVHLPPGLSHRERSFMLDYRNPWQYAFIDDLRICSDIIGPSLSQLMLQPLHCIISAKLIDINNLIQKSISDALCRCIPPLSIMDSSNDDLLNSESTYMKMLKFLLQEERFKEYFVNCILECFRSVSNDDALPLHVSIATQDRNCAGSMRQAILTAIESLTSQALGHIIRQLDKHFNLSWLYFRLKDFKKENNAAIDFWYSTLMKLLEPAVVASTCPLVAPSDLHQTECKISNFGKFGPLRSQIPFSDRIISFLNNEESRAKLEGVTTSLKDVKRSLQTFLISYLGESLNEQLKNVLGLHPLAYLHDFVALTVHPVSALDFETHMLIIRIVIDAADPLSRGDYSPARVQACYWQHELRIFHVLSLGSAVKKVNQSYHNDCVSAMLSRSSLNCEEVGEEDGKLCELKSIALLDTALSSYVLDILYRDMLDIIQEYEEAEEVVDKESKLSVAVKFTNALVSWSQSARTLESDVKLIISFILNNSFAREDNDMNRLVNQNILVKWWGLRFVSVLIPELCFSKSISVSKKVTILSMAMECKPMSAQSLAAFDSLCSTLFSGLSGLLYSYLKFMSMEYMFLKGSLFEIRYDSFMIQALAEIICRRNCSLAARKHALNVLSNIIEKSYYEKIPTDIEIVCNVLKRSILNEIQLTILCVQRYEDNQKISSDLPHEAVDTSMQGISGILLTLTPASSLEYLSERFPSIIDQICTVRHVLGRLAITISDYLSLDLKLSENNNVMELDFGFVSAQTLKLISDLPDLYIYLLKVLKSLGGEDLLLKFLKWKSCPLIPLHNMCKIEDVEENEIILINPFTELFQNEVYVSAITFIKQLCYDGSMMEGVSSSVGLVRDWMQSIHVKDLPMEQKIALIISVMFHKSLDLEPSVDRMSLANYIVSCLRFKKSFVENDVFKNLIEFILLNESNLRMDEREKNIKLMKHKYDQENQLLIHMALIAIYHPTSWLAVLLRTPSEMKKCLFPSFPFDTLALLMTMNVNESVGWYRCPNGHPYTVGQCTMPMETAICSASGCGAVIGGREHTPSKGNTKFYALDPVAQAGYDLQVTTNPNSYKIDRISVLTTQIIRLIIHSIMHLSIKLFPVNIIDITSLLYPTSSRAKDNVAAEKLSQLRTQDWEAMKNTCKLCDDDLYSGLHFILNKWILSGKNLFSPTLSRFEM